MVRFAGSLLSVVVLLVAATNARADDVRVIVGFKGQPDVSILKKHGAEDKETIYGTRSVAASIDPVDIAALRAEEDVAFVEEDAIAEASKRPGTTQPPPSTEPQPIPWNVNKVWGGDTCAVTGLGIKVAVVDTGVQTDHPDLPKLAGGKSFVTRVSSYTDDNGHGTHVAGIVCAQDNTIGVVGVAPAVSLYSVKVLDRRGSGYYSWIIGGIEWCGDQGMHVANMSFGGSSSTTDLEGACKYAESKGVLLVAAAGNEGDGNPATPETSYPAAYASVISVGATDKNDALAYFSNTGPHVELSAPGVSIYSTYKGSTYATLSGTSMASPHVAGVAALIWQKLGTATAAGVRKELKEHVTDLGSQGYDYGFGYGRVFYYDPIIP